MHVHSETHDAYRFLFVTAAAKGANESDQGRGKLGSLAPVVNHAKNAIAIRNGINILGLAGSTGRNAGRSYVDYRRPSGIDIHARLRICATVEKGESTVEIG